MEIDRLRTIIAYSDKNREDIHSMVKRFCSFAGIEYESDLLNVLQIVRSSFKKRGYLVFEMPFADDEIGALCYKGDGMGYVVLNTSLPRVNVNFAIAHEIYHVFFGSDELVSKVEFADDHYYEHEEEYAANLFAGMLLMPEVSFRRMFSKFKEDSDGNRAEIIIRLMSYYQVPYMAVLIRSLELGMIARSEVREETFNIERDHINEKLKDLWLDESIMEPSRKDDYAHIETVVSTVGKEFVEDEYINKRTVNKALKNMRELYLKIKGT
ncbi:ImmA/IrrE family metallo-endopeptidase [Selenomonas ruminantium]|uniref:IrrE N-terminal-like domain-containing protein n=1 Tax=Selenomonas ruminantium TaxID=971 RepID=A0A1H0S548_SELRU|nr:ImmA/IrrE family metallo-endopeptidase [Selenomonas ruminantium]SDP36388.1 protein of unknown function [Selenomonas ruminantium]